MKEIETALRDLPEVRDAVQVARVDAPLDRGTGNPRTLIEDLIAEIAAATLGREHVGVYDRLFDSAGGASHAAKVIRKIQDSFQVVLPPSGSGNDWTVVSLARLVEAAFQDHAEGPGCSPVAARCSGDLHLSGAQQRLWFLNQLQPADYSSHHSVATRLRGPLDVAALGRSLAESARRHQELRVQFPKLDGRPIRRICPDVQGDLPVEDLTTVSESAREESAMRLVEIEARRPFDLTQAPAWRARLLRLAPTDHVLVITLHQIIADRQSMDILFQELKCLYRGFVEGGVPDMVPLDATYSDYAEWKQQWLQGGVLERQLAFWKQQLEGAPAALDLPCDRPRPAVQDPRGASQSCLLPNDLVRRLRALSREEGVTPFLTLLAAFQVLLQRYTGARDVLVGTPASRRYRSDLEGVIGPLTNTLVWHGRLGDNPTFREFLGRIKSSAFLACRHQDLPFARLVEELHPDRNLSQAPVFQVMFDRVFEGAETLTLSGLDCSPALAGFAGIDLDLKLTVVEGGPASRIVLDYSSDLFDASTITRMLGCWMTLLESVVMDADQRVSDLELLAESDRRRLLVEWNGASIAYPPAPSFVRLFEQEVERHPDALAVVCENTHLTYAELNARANQLARHLSSLGVGPDILVALSVERSLDMTIGLLGVLKAGGGYVPLDPEYPRERLAYMLKDAAPAVVLTQRHLRSALPPTSAHVVCLDEDWATIEATDPANLNNEIAPENLAYVIYTSGSTGRPKGVLITHRGLLNLAQTVVQRYDLQARDKVLQFSTLSFDIAVEEIFPTWLCGASLVLRSDRMPPAFPGFLRFVAKRRVTVLNLPTAFWHEWVQHLSESDATLPAALRLVIVGGEQVSAAAYSKWRSLAGNRVRWLNGYGPTEATVTSTVFEPGPSESMEPIPTPIPIGRPIANTEVLVLDSFLQPVPIGVSGELHVGGAGVARGYLNLPDLTAERFIPHPFCGDPRARLYKTGDRVRYLPDGNLQFLGRIDQQVKIRGFRVELGEVEAVLGQHPDVAEVIAKAWKGNSEDSQLIGYVVPRTGVTVATNDLRAFLKARLPEHLVPAQIMVLTAFPLTPNGKLDHRALPAPDRAIEPAGGESPVARDRLELQLIQIWREVLGVSRVGIRDSFFDLGGHSLMAVRMFSQIEKLVGKPLPLAILFQAPTIEQLARIIRHEGWEPSKSSLVAIQPKGSKRPFFCVHGGGGGVLFYSDLARHLGGNQPFYGFQSPGYDAEREPLRSISDMASLYLAELRGVQPKGPYLIGGASLGGVVAYEMAQRLVAQGEEVALLAMMDTSRPIPLSRMGYRIQTVIGKLRNFRNQFQSALDGTRQKESKERAPIGVVRNPGRRSSPQGDNQELEPPGPPNVAVSPHAKARARVYRANSLALALYAPQPYAGRLTLFVAKDCEAEFLADRSLGWDAWVGQLEKYEVPGDHNSMLREPMVRVLADRLQKCLEQAHSVHVTASTLFLLLSENFPSTPALPVGRSGGNPGPDRLG